MPPSSSPDVEDLDTQFLDPSTLTKDTTPPTSLQTSISPPPPRSRRSKDKQKQHSCGGNGNAKEHATLNLAAIEAGEVRIDDHISHFSTQLARFVRPPPSNSPKSYPLLPIREWQALYRRNQHPQGHHFVVHQHDHPIAGVHYDLRLQINKTSSISWAIMYGLPGNANSRRLNRNATETRVHTVWNHLIETASQSTGSLLIWDTGEYEILPYHELTHQSTDDELSSSSSSSSSNHSPPSKLSNSKELHRAFQNRKIRIRLHGTRLPKNYTLSIRLPTSENRHSQPQAPSRKRRRKPTTTPPTSDIEDNQTMRETYPVPADPSASNIESDLALQENEQIRLTNAYPGAANGISSIYQRRWFLSLDRYASGFCPLASPLRGGTEWVRRWDGEEGRLLGFEPFCVLGREVERSVVSGRVAGEVLGDEGVKGFVGRKGWRGVIE